MPTPEKYDQEMQEEALAGLLARRAIRLTREGKIEWDFKHFRNGILDNTATANRSGLYYASDNIQDGGINFYIYLGEPISSIELEGGTNAELLAHYHNNELAYEMRDILESEYELQRVTALADNQ